MDRPVPFGCSHSTSFHPSVFSTTDSSLPDSTEDSTMELLTVSWISRDSSDPNLTGDITQISQSPDVFTFDNTKSLCEDLRCIISLPEMCNVTFLVGKDQVPIYGLKAILATRSRTFFQTLITQHECSVNGVVKAKKTSCLMSGLRRLARGLGQKRPLAGGLTHRDHLTVRVEQFSPLIFRQLVEFLHIGEIQLNIDNVFGILNAADSFGVDDLRAACVTLVRRLIDFNTVFPLLTIAQAYTHFPLTSAVIAEIMSFIDTNAQTVLRLKNLDILSKNLLTDLLVRATLRATKSAKWDAALHWSRRHCAGRGSDQLRVTLKAFTPLINFSDIPLKKLSEEILPLGVLQDDIIRDAIACQSAFDHRRYFSLRKQKASVCLRRVFTVRPRRPSDDNGFAVSVGDSVSS